MFMSVFQWVYLYIIYLNKLYNVIINCRHLTIFAFNYIYFRRCLFVMMIRTVFLWLSMAISDFLL